MLVGDRKGVIFCMLEDFYVTYAAQEEFISYFKRTWHGQAGMHACVLMLLYVQLKFTLTLDIAGQAALT